MKVVTAAQMKEIDRKASAEYGILGIVLMENAGIQVVKILKENYGGLKRKKIALFVGKGNNGGDGLVAARHLHNQGFRISVYLFAQRESLSKDAAINYQICRQSGIRIIEVKSEAEFLFLQQEIIHHHLFIDALLGTGINSALRGFYKGAVSFLNKCRRPIISLDIPSGLSADTGEIIGEHIRAELTVTLGLPKIGLLIYPAAKEVGKLKIADIALPPALIEKEKIKLELLEAKKIKEKFPAREQNTHKGTYGHILIVGGSAGKGGAAVMASLSALKAGSGLVSLAIPQGLNLALEKGFPEIMTIPLPQTRAGFLTSQAKDTLLREVRDKSCLLAGPGLGTHPRTVKLLKEFLKEIDCPLILDADALNIIAGDLTLFHKLPRPLLITPHPGEMSRLTGLSVPEIQKDRLGAAGNLARKFNIYVVLKGARTIIATPREELFINPTGNPGMATAGSGDVLGGIIAGFAAQKMDFLSAVQAGVYLHGLAGDLVSKERGELCLLASDIIKELPAAIRRVVINQPKP